MKKCFLFVLTLTFCFFLSAQEKMFIHKTDKITLGALISEIDSVEFSEDASTVYFYMGISKLEYPVSAIDSLSFGNNSNTISINYNGNTASVINPLAFEGVTVTVSGADVTINSTNESRDIQYLLTGSTTNGSFKAYSTKGFTLALKGVSITNTDGPAINIQSKKEVIVWLAEGTTNSLSDGSNYAPAVMTGGIAEDQSAAFFSEGQLLFNGPGSLSIQANGSEQHALASDDFIQVDNGTIGITKSVKDGIHTKDGFTQNGGSLTITANSDGIDGDISFINITGGTTNISCSTSDANGICCDSTLSISGGNINITVSGVKSKGLKSIQAMTLSGGNITVTASGGVELIAAGAGVDPSYCTGIKCTAGITVSGANIAINHTGISGKGISSDTYSMTSGIVNINTTGNGAVYTNSLGGIDAYSAACISTDGVMNILGGTVNASSTGVGGKGLSSNGILTIGSSASAPAVYVGTSGAAVTYLTNSITEPKAIKGDADIYLVNGTVSVNALGAGEGIDSKGSIYMSGGTVTVQGSALTNIKAIDYELNFNVTGGTLMACGPYRSKSIPTPTTSTSTQNFIYATMASTTAILPAATIFNIQDGSGNSLVTFQPMRNSYYFIFSSPGIQKSTSYDIYTGGSSTGTAVNGLFTGGLYSQGTKKKTFITTTSSKTSTSFSL